MIDRRLISTINGGRCFALVGSGPSCEAGYPSWRELAQMAYDALSKEGTVSDHTSYKKLLDEKKYPELFRQIERDLDDDRGALAELLKPLLVPKQAHHRFLYGLLCKWPFAGYLTTNYDDEIVNHLLSMNEHYQVVRNRPADFHVWREGVSRIVQKLHSDLNHPEEAVITSADYRRLYIESTGAYFREALCKIFATFSVFIVGHSLSDPDMDYILSLAKVHRSAQQPIYMVAADFSRADEYEYCEKYNIVLVKYSNSDGTYSELRRLLRTADRYIVPRDRFPERIVISARPEEESKAAVAIYLYRRLQGVTATDYLSPLVLFGLHSSDSGEVERQDIASLPAIRSLVGGRSDYNEAIEESLRSLTESGLISASGDRIRITGGGRTKVEEYQVVRKTESAQAYGQFRVYLKSLYSGVTESQLDQCERLVENVVVATFARRGSGIANRIFSEQSALPEELSDIFGCVSDQAVEIADRELRVAFLEAVHQFIVTPTAQQRLYLASVSQGYFLFHLLGLDPKCCEMRRSIFRKTLWLCDSSVILRGVAVGCNEHEFSCELLRVLEEEDALLWTTTKLLQEAWEHLDWALRFVQEHGTASIGFLRAAILDGSYEQNLFFDGYIRLRADGRVGSFRDYLELSFGAADVDRSIFDRTVAGIGLRVTNISSVEGFVNDDWGDVEGDRLDIRKERMGRGTLRSELQIESEAEVSVLLANLRSGRYSILGVENAERFYFVSRSRVMDYAVSQGNIVTWAPEALYRYLSSLPGREIDPSLLQQCMIGEYYYAGIELMDRAKYERYFGRMIDASKALYKEEIEGYVRDLEDDAEGVEDAYKSTPDLEKPLFVVQVGWRLAESAVHRERVGARERMELERKVKELEGELKKSRRSKETQRQERARARNQQDPKHVKKRARQAKKRRKKRKRAG